MFQIRWLWSNMEKRDRRMYIFAIFLSVSTTAMMLVNPYLSAELVDRVIVARDTEPLVPLLTAMFLVQAVLQGLRYLMVICFERSSQNMVYNIKKHLFHNLQH